jgi:hypothetical protein
MKTKYLLTAALVATLTFAAPTAMAQRHGHSGMQGADAQQGMMGRGMHGSMMQRRMMGGDCPMMGMMTGAAEGTFAEGRIAFLKAELAITDAQKPAFDAYAEVLRSNLQNMHSMRQSMMGMTMAKTPVERLETHLAMMEGRIASLREVKPKLEALYATLSDDQKKKANALLTGMGCMM